MNRTKQRQEIIKIFRQTYSYGYIEIKTKFSTGLDALRVDIDYDLLFSRTVENLIDSGYSKFNVISDSNKLQINVYFKKID